MSESRYRGVKITTQQLGSDRWLAHSGYGDTTDDSEREAIAALRKTIDRELGATAARDKASAAKVAAKAARQKRYRVEFTDGTSIYVKAENETQARTRARSERFGRKRDMFGPEPKPSSVERRS